MPVEQLTWYVARSSGLVAYALLAAAVLGGLVLAARPRPARPPSAWVLDLHRFLGGLASVFTGVHLVAILLDDHEDFGLVELLVPLTASYRPVAVAWGVVALYLLLAVELTSLARARLPHRLWRRVHLTSLPLLVLATVHLVTAGTDGDHPLVLAGVIGLGTAVALAAARRLGSRRDGPARAPVERHRPTRTARGPRRGLPGPPARPAGGRGAG